MATQTGRRPAYHTKKIEESEQQKFVNWVRREFPHVIIYCDGIGEDLTDTQRTRLMAMRTRDGMPDVYIDFPSRGYHGARFEFKRPDFVLYKKDGKTLRADPYTRRYTKHGKLFIKSGDHLQEQAMTLREYNALGYFGRFVKGLDHGKRMFNWYMQIPEPTELDLPF